MVTANKSQQLFRHSFSKRLIILIYGIIWLAALLAGYLLLDSIFAASDSIALNLLIATAAAGLAGGLGGTTALLNHLADTGSESSQAKSFFSYLFQPVVGLIAGIVALYLVAIPGALIMNLAANQGLMLGQTLESPVFVAIQLLLGWMAGFYQIRNLAKIKSIARSTGQEPPGEGAPPPVINKNEPMFYKAWYLYQRRVTRWSYTWGLFLLMYAIIWMMGLLTIYFLTGDILAGLESGNQIIATGLVLAAWPAAIAGGLGGVCAILYDLRRHVSDRQDFHRRYLVSYLARPVIGFALGLAIYFLLASGYLAIANPGEAPPRATESARVIMLLLLVGWIAGFRQQTVAQFTRRLIQHLLAFFKSALAILHPKNLFNVQRRTEMLKEVSEQSEFFSAVETRKADTPSSRQK